VIKLANEPTGDALSLTCGGVLIDRVSYVNPMSGRSFSLDPGHLTASENDVVANWCLGVGVYRGSDQGSPGTTNPPCP
jgi:hypothetical protein